jgi:hypothetical protein
MNEDTCGAHIYTGWHSTEGRPCDCHGVIQDLTRLGGQAESPSAGDCLSGPEVAPQAPGTAAPKRIQPEPNEIGYT